jgi:hypothetical protein
VRRITPDPHDERTGLPPEGTAPGTGENTDTDTGQHGSTGTSTGAGVHAAVLEWTSPGGLVHRTAPEHTLACTAPERRSTPATGRPPGDPPPAGRPDHAAPDDPPPF